MHYFKEVINYCRKFKCWEYILEDSQKEKFKMGLTYNLNNKKYFGFYSCDEFSLIRVFGIYLRIGDTENQGG